MPGTAVALHPDVERLTEFFRDLRFTPYAPLCRHLLKLLWRTNGRRKTAGLGPVSTRALRLRRWTGLPFGAGKQTAEAADARLGDPPQISTGLPRELTPPQVET
jgi:hypothetical protein